MRIKAGDKWFECTPDSPIMVELTPADKANIEAMPEQATKYACFSDPDARTREEKFAWMNDPPAPSSGKVPDMMWGCEVGSPEWYAIVERTEWATVGAIAKDAQGYLVGFGFRYSALDVAISLCEARAKKGWRSFVAVGAVPASSAEGGKSPESPPTFGGETAAIGSRWKHLKTGGIYIVVGPSIIERTNEPAILYQREGDGTLWVRPTDEFLDGRFEPVDLPPAADAHDDEERLVSLREAAESLLASFDKDCRMVGYRTDLWSALRACLERSQRVDQSGAPDWLTQPGAFVLLQGESDAG